MPRDCKWASDCNSLHFHITYVSKWQAKSKEFGELSTLVGTSPLDEQSSNRAAP